MGKIRAMKEEIEAILDNVGVDLDDEIQTMVEDKVDEARDMMRAQIEEYLDMKFDGELDVYDLEEMGFDLDEAIEEAIDNNRCSW